MLGPMGTIAAVTVLLQYSPVPFDLTTRAHAARVSCLVTKEETT